MCIVILKPHHCSVRKDTIMADNIVDSQPTDDGIDYDTRPVQGKVVKQKLADIESKLKALGEVRFEDTSDDTLWYAFDEAICMADYRFWLKLSQDPSKEIEFRFKATAWDNLDLDKMFTIHLGELSGAFREWNDDSLKEVIRGCTEGVTDGEKYVEPEEIEGVKEVTEVNV